MLKRIPLFIVIYAVIILTSACDRSPDVATIGKLSPDFSLVDKSGKIWTLSDLRGQVVFLNFWATWCPSCVEEIPSMERLYSTVPSAKFKMLAVLVNDAPSNGESFAKKIGMHIPILYDQAAALGPKYGLTGVPETYIIDKKGVLREKFIGPARWDSPDAMQMLLKYIKQ